MKPCILFGRSPFINQIDVPRLTSQFYSIATNGFSRYFKVNTIVFFDEHQADYQADQAWLPYYHSQRHNDPKVTHYYPHCHSDTPLKQWQYHTRLDYPEPLPSLGYKCFGTSPAFNLATLTTGGPIFLVGVDHIESQETFTHFDGTGCEPGTTFTQGSHRSLKYFIGSVQPTIKVYQCNPDVANDWPVPYYPIEDLYNGPPRQDETNPSV